jgi:hypothetical protein
MTRTIRLLIIATMIATSISTAAAQGVRMRGTIEKIAGNEISMQSTDGDQIKLTLTENAVIVAVVRASMADIKEGTFLGSAPIVRYEIGNGSDLKPGARLTVLAANQKPDGTLEADRINVGRDGVVPQ